MTQLAGQFSIQTVLKATYLTAVDGGGQTTDAIYTNVWQAVGPNEKFTLWVSGNPYYAFQTADGSYLTAVNGGGLTTNAVETAPKQLNAWALFKLVPSYNAAGLPPFPVAIQTLRGFFLTAVGGGGQADADAIHADGTKAQSWEYFLVLRGGELGSGSSYIIMGLSDGALGGWLQANNGGLDAGPGALAAPANSPNPLYWEQWVLVKQTDGTYALQTSSGGYLTANGGGDPDAGFRTDIMTVGDWEKFTLVDNGDITWYIKTSNGYYLSMSGPGESITTVQDSNQATKWWFQLNSF
jgi:hypothetical protein